MLVLITGANGFVGRATVRAFRGAGDRVRAASRTVSPGDWDELVLAPDLARPADWADAVAGVDVVVHLAARVHVMRESLTGALAAYRQINVEGTRQLAEQAASAGVRRFVFVSSVKVNGEATHPGRPFTERDAPVPVDPYGVSKLEAEAEIRAISRRTGMEFVIVRPPLVYGPGVKANFQRMVEWIRRGIPLPFGSVRANRRSLVAVDNLADFLVRCATARAAAGELFLVADDEALSTAELLRRTARAMRRPARLVPIPTAVIEMVARAAGKADVAQRLCGSLEVDSSKAKRLLSWHPPLSVDEGLRRAIVL